jgi:hypothetical protein
MNRILMPAALIAVLTMLSGCNEFIARQELLEPYSGNAIAQNQVLQMRDPWPPYVYDSNILTSAQRQAGAYRKYSGAHDKDEAPSDLQSVQLVVPSGQ